MMTHLELKALAFGRVVWAMRDDEYYRKGRWETWHPISQVDGQRVGQRDAIRTADLQHLLGPVTNATAETQRLTKIKERRNA